MDREAAFRAFPEYRQPERKLEILQNREIIAHRLSLCT